MHFNAAMLELNSRLHSLDERARARGAAARHSATDLPAAAEAAAAMTDPAAAAAAAPCPTIAAASSASSSNGVAGAGRDMCEQADAESDKQVAAWFDESSARQREAKAAVLAIRRHLRAARAGRVPQAQLAAANAHVMSAAARGLIRGGHVGRGSAKQQAPLAALLCFDEMQVRPDAEARNCAHMLSVQAACSCGHSLTCGQAVPDNSRAFELELVAHGIHMPRAAASALAFPLSNAHMHHCFPVHRCRMFSVLPPSRRCWRPWQPRAL